MPSELNKDMMPFTASGKPGKGKKKPAKKTGAMGTPKKKKVTRKRAARKTRK